MNAPASPKLLLPLRVPELGSSLGRLVTGTGRYPSGLALDAVRVRLATRVMEDAGEARRLAARDEREAALATVGRAAWLEAWEEAVAAVADLIVARVSEHLDAEADAVHMPRRLRRAYRMDAVDERALRARLGSAGVGLVSALDWMDRCAEQARYATARERAAVEAWQQALTTCARRLEDAWLALEAAVETELGRWERVADQVAAWRKPLWPVVAVGAVALGAAVWLGLVLGGYVPPPRWFARLWQQVFGA